MVLMCDRETRVSRGWKWRDRHPGKVLEAAINEVIVFANPADAKSIFYLWAKEPAARKLAAKKGLTLVKQRLWGDYLDHKGPSYCFIRDGKPLDDIKSISEKPDVPQLSDYAGYDHSSRTHWAFLARKEFYDPQLNAGLTALSAACEGLAAARKGCRGCSFTTWPATSTNGGTSRPINPR